MLSLIVWSVLIQIICQLCEQGKNGSSTTATADQQKKEAPATAKNTDVCFLFHEMLEAM